MKNNKSKFTITMNGKKYKLRSKLRLFAVIAALAIMVNVGINVTNTVKDTITDVYQNIAELNSKQVDLELSIDDINNKLDEQKNVSTKLIELLEQQNKINNYDPNDRAYYTMSDRGIGLEPREISENKMINTSEIIEMNINRVSLSNRLSNIEEAQIKEIQRQQEQINDFSSFYTKATGNTDLCGYVNINEEEFNKFIDKSAPKNSPFIGRADVFLKASEITGLDPRYILAHASIESGWGTSPMCRNKGNYFGIGAFDSDPGNAHNMGSNLEGGIINGAKWIKKYYYDRGKTTLNKMKAAGYASDEYWVAKIVSNMN